MNKFFKSMSSSVQSFVRDEEGAQVIEYALIIAVVSIGLVLALSTLLTGGPFTSFITRVTACLSGGVCTASAAAP